MGFAGVQFYLIRHAPVVTKHIYTGWTDAACILPVEFYPEAFSDFSADSIWLTSDLQRSMTTAHWVCDQLVLPPQFMPAHELREQNFGEWEGQPYSEIYANSPLLNWDEPATVQPPNGESFVEVCARVEDWLEGILTQSSASSYCVVAHAGSIRAILAHGLGLNPQQALMLQLDTGSISRLNYYAPKRGAASISYINRIVFK